MVTVGKFGGGTFLDPSSKTLFQRIMDDDPQRRFFVFSALGSKGLKEDRVTQLLVRMAHAKGNDEVEASRCLDRIVEKHEEVFPHSTARVAEILRTEYALNLPPAQFMARLKSRGEYLAAMLVAERYNLQFVDAAEVIKVEGRHDKACLLPVTYQFLAARFMGEKGRFAIPGFYGEHTDGSLATFEFGGSDITGSLVARGVNACIYENWTETSIRAAHPNIVPNARRIAEMTRKELRDLAYSGFSIFHDDAIQPLLPTPIKVHVRSTGHYPDEGTWVVEDRVSDPTQPIIGIAYRPGLCYFVIEKTGLDNITGILYDALGVFKRRSIPVYSAPAGVDDVSIIVDQAAVVGHVDEIKAELNEAVEGNETDAFGEHIGLVVVAGKGLRGNGAVDGRIRMLLHEQRISVIASDAGTPQRCFLYAVPEMQGPAAVQAIYKEFIG